MWSHTHPKTAPIMKAFPFRYSRDDLVRDQVRPVKPRRTCANAPSVCGSQPSRRVIIVDAHDEALEILLYPGLLYRMCKAAGVQLRVPHLQSRIGLIRQPRYIHVRLMWGAEVVVFDACDTTCGRFSAWKAMRGGSRD
jgi:hypothetical protein